MNGTDLKWDVERVMASIDKSLTQTQEKRGVKDWAYLLDFNEKCPNVDYFHQFCRQLKEKCRLATKGSITRNSLPRAI